MNISLSSFQNAINRLLSQLGTILLPAFLLIHLVFRLLTWYCFNTLIAAVLWPLSLSRIWLLFSEDLYNEKKDNKFYVGLKKFSGKGKVKNTFVTDLREALKDFFSQQGTNVVNGAGAVAVVYYTAAREAFYVSFVLTGFAIYVNWFGQYTKSKSIFSKYSGILETDFVFYAFPIFRLGEVGCHPAKKVAFISEGRLNNKSGLPALQQVAGLSQVSTQSIYPKIVSKFVRSEFELTVDSFNDNEKSFEFWINIYVSSYHVWTFRIDEQVVQVTEEECNSLTSFLCGILHNKFYLCEGHGIGTVAHSHAMNETISYLIESIRNGHTIFVEKRTEWVGGLQDTYDSQVLQIPQYNMV